MSYGQDMSPFKPTQLPSPAEQEERLAAAMNATVVLPATEVDSSGAAAQRQVGEWFEGDPPKTEPEILAAVRATRDQILTETVSPPAVMELICRRTQYLTDASGAVIEF